MQKSVRKARYRSDSQCGPQVFEDVRQNIFISNR